ncbi:unnamed protein product [Cylicocyclus nassatus]|uniref:Uncharacterized protein n=1 Tax=Cylicocyclus nassatus TaxID=53992 RepID=A0AA36DSS4_CYLNA|nr:unnamed protein product [Cylicocyclus nassatus]
MSVSNFRLSSCNGQEVLRTKTYHKVATKNLGTGKVGKRSISNKFSRLIAEPDFNPNIPEPVAARRHQFLPLETKITNVNDKVMGDEGPLLVYYNYHSVPISQEKIESLIKHVVIKLSAEFDKFYFCCDVRATPKDITDYAEHFQHGEIAHMSLSTEGSIEEALCQRMLWHASTINGGPGLIALVSDAGNYGPTLTALARGGWRIAIFHPPETSSTFLDYADEAFALPIHREQIEEGQQVGNLPYVLNFQSLPPPPQQEDCVTAMAQDLRQNLTRLLSRLSGAMAPAPPRGGSTDPAQPTETTNTSEKFVNSNMMQTTESLRSSDSSQNLYASVDSIDDGGSQNIYAPQMLPGFLPQNQFVPVSYAPPPYAQLMEPPRFCAKCGRDAAAEVGAEAPREQKNPFSQTERRNPFQHNPFQKGHDDKRRASYGMRNDMWKDGGDGENGGYGGKIRKDDEQGDVQECGWKPGRGNSRNPFSTTANNSPTQYKGREPRDSEQREKFRKPAPQCPQWEDRHHRINNNCPLWHPYKMCLFYPNCRSTALDCGYAHPFCSEDECECAEDAKDPQLNHWIGPARTYVD